MDRMMLSWLYQLNTNYQILQEMTQRWAPKKPNFGPPPAGYIAGLGRGATGFITRSDIGTARLPDANKNVQANEVDEANYNTQIKFDQWEGYSGALFTKGNLDDEDKLAQEAYDFCEKRLWGRRQKERQLEQEKAKKEAQIDNSITSKFVDLKRQLANVSTQQWESIPDCVDLSIKKRKRDKLTPVPDSIIMNLLTSKEGIKTISVAQEQNINDFHEAKEVLLKSKLDNLESSVSGKSNVDKVGYITQLNSQKLDAEFLGDVKKARMLLKSAIASNPKNPDIWLSAARVEELDGKLKDCRDILRKAIESCPLSEDLWIQLSRIEKADQSKDVLIEGLRHLPSSEKLWLYAARRQNENKDMKSKIIRKGLENIPTSVKLWRELIEMESVQQAKKLLYKAVQSLPKEIDLWLALAKTEDYKSAQKVLNKARKCNPLSLTIWISAARLEETQSKVEPIANIHQKIETVLTKGRQILKKNGANITRQEWLQEALYAQKSQSLIVCEMLVKISVKYGLAEQEIHNVLLKDVKFYQKEKQCNHTTRFLYRYGILETKSKQLMKEFIQFQNRKKMKKQYQEVNRTLKFALKIFENDKDFWKVIINKLIKEYNYEAALQMIKQSKQKITKEDEEQIRILEVKILVLQQNIKEARQKLQQLRFLYPKGLSVFQSIRLQYQTANYAQAWNLCQKYFKESKSVDIWRLAFRIKQKVGTYAQAFAIIERATFFFPDCLSVWKDIIEFELQNKHASKARAFLDKAIQRMPKCEELYIISIELERKMKYKKEAVSALAKAIKVFPKNPEIWAIAIELQPENTRKKKASSAIQICGQSPHINCSIAKVFWKENKIDKARRWFQQALKMNPNNGDIWAYYLRLLEVNYVGEKEIKQNEFLQIEGNLEGRKWAKVKENQGGWKLENKEVLRILMNEVDQEINGMD